jgi:membrane-associated phospholipid phosphatase
MTLKKRLFCLSIAKVLLFTVNVNISSANDQDVIDNSDDAAMALFLAAYASTAIAQDWEGAKQFTYSIGTTAIITRLLKNNTSKNRPLSYNNESFPSGHSALAFSSAAFIDTRYGHYGGIPAYALATYVGYSRVVADAHHVADVLAGMSIGLFSNWYWVKPRKANISVLPTLVEDGVGLSINVIEPSKKNRSSIVNDAYPKNRYEMSFGPTRLERDQITSPAATGTTFDLFDFYAFGNNSDKTTTANLYISSQLNKYHTIGISIEPYETYDVRELSYTVSFAGTTFPAKSHVEASYRRTDIRLNYFFNLTPDYKGNIKIGAALTALRTSIKLEDISRAGTVDEWVFFPLVHIEADYPLSTHWAIFAFASGASWLDVNYINAKLMLRYHFDKHWDAGIGIGAYDSKLDIPELKNDLKYNSLLFSVAYNF